MATLPLRVFPLSSSSSFNFLRPLIVQEHDSFYFPGGGEGEGEKTGSNRGLICLQIGKGEEESLRRKRKLLFLVRLETRGMKNENVRGNNLMSPSLAKQKQSERRGSSCSLLCFDAKIAPEFY